MLWMSCPTTRSDRQFDCLRCDRWVYIAGRAADSGIPRDDATKFNNRLLDERQNRFVQLAANGIEWSGRKVPNVVELFRKAKKLAKCGPEVRFPFGFSPFLFFSLIVAGFPLNLSNRVRRRSLDELHDAVTFLHGKSHRFEQVVNVFVVVRAERHDIAQLFRADAVISDVVKLKLRIAAQTAHLLAVALLVLLAEPNPVVRPKVLIVGVEPECFPSHR